MKSNTPQLFVRLALILAQVVLLAFGTFDRASAATIIYVNAAAAGANNGTSWANAYKSLQSALSAAVSGDQIWVAKGTYKPTHASLSTNPRSKTFALKNGVAIYGGFAGTETSLTQRKPRINITTLSGNIGQAGTSLDNSYHVVTGSSVSSTAILDGFVITAGMASGVGAFDDGGGVYIGAGSPTLRNLVITANGAAYGGGMLSNNGSPALLNVTFSNNTAGIDGGGVYNFEGFTIYTDVTFSGNTAQNGAGMYNDTLLGQIITNATFYNNGASSNGGGMYNTGSALTLRNTTFTANFASSSGGGIYDTSASNPTVVESVMWNDGSELVDSSSNSTITDAIVQGGCPSVNSNCTNVINSDPLLGSLMFHGGFTQTVALGKGSPAIDAGGINAPCATKDQRGVKRPQGGQCDLGAYEVNVAVFRSVGLLDGTVVESAQNSMLGGSFNNTAATFRVGDTQLNQQLMGILSFNTSALPDAASVIAASVAITQQSVAGVSPFITHGNLLIDVTRPYFGSSVSLAASDFQATAMDPVDNTFDSVPVGSVYSAPMADAGLALINLVGPTQIRLHFTFPDDNDGVADYVAFYSGDTTTAFLQPRLVVYYNP